MSATPEGDPLSILIDADRRSADAKRLADEIRTWDTKQNEVWFRVRRAMTALGERFDPEWDTQLLARALRESTNALRDAGVDEVVCRRLPDDSEPMQLARTALAAALAGHAGQAAKLLLGNQHWADIRQQWAALEKVGREVYFERVGTERKRTFPGAEAGIPAPPPATGASSGSGMLPVDEDQPSQRQDAILSTMYEIGALSERQLKTRQVIASKVKRGLSASSIGTDFVALKKKSFIRTNVGNKGGCWLTAKGIERAKKNLSPPATTNP